MPTRESGMGNREWVSVIGASSIPDSRFPIPSRRDRCLFPNDRVVLPPPRWREPGVEDQALQFFRRGAMRRARRGHHVLLDHERAEIIAAEAECELADLES